MDDEAWESVVAAAVKVADVSVHSASESRDRLKAVFGSLLTEHPKFPWWAGLRDPKQTIDYGPGDAFFNHLRGLLVYRRGVLLLVPMEEDGRPLGLVTGPAESLIDTIGDSVGVEFLITDAQGAWAVADTHHNQLIVVDPVGSTAP